MSTTPAAAATPPTVVVAHPSADLYGSDRTLLESVEALAAGGYRVVTVLPEPGPLVGHLKRAGSEVRFRRSPVLRKAHLTPAGILRLALSVRLLPGLCRLLRRERSALVYVNTVTIPLWLLAARACRIPVLCHVHEAEQGLGRLIGWGLAAPLSLATRIIANSRASVDVLTAHIGWLRARTEVVYNGVPGPDRPTELRPSRPGRIGLLLVGRIAPRKGTDLAIAAARQLCDLGYDVGLEIVGSHFPGYEWFEADVRDQAAVPELAGRVTFTGFTDDVWAAFERSDIVLVPSRSEPFGNVAVEGMLARRPVVAAAVQGLREIISSGETGVLVAPEDATALAAAVRNLCDDWPRAQHLAEAGRARAQAAFSTDRYRREIRDVVDATVRARTSGDEH